MIEICSKSTWVSRRSIFTPRIYQKSISKDALINIQTISEDSSSIRHGNVERISNYPMICSLKRNKSSESNKK